MRSIRPLPLLLACVALSPPAHTQPVPLQGCYARVYDAAHLAAHKRQIVVRATLSVAPTRAEARVRETHVASAELKVWVRGRKQSFDSSGACSVSSTGLTCLGSLSAAEADTCRSKRDGVHDCRVDANDPGSFNLEPRGRGVLVTVHERLELVRAPYDSGPFLTLSPDNAENRSFLLQRTPCR
jgi:hypothetical protein